MSWSSEITADSPLAWWRQDDTSGTTMTDSSGNARHGTYNTVPTFSQTSLVASDANLAADYSTDYADITNDTWMHVAALTIEAWYKPDAAAGSEELIVNRFSNVTSARVWALRRTSSGAVHFQWYDSGGTQRAFTGATALVAGTAYHVVGTVDSSGVGRIYVNGTLDGTLDPGTGLGIRTVSAASLRVGNYNGGSNAYADGVIDEVAFYGTALSGTRILAHYNAASGGVTVSGGTATETDTAQAGSVQVNQTVAGGQASTLATAVAGVVLAGALVVGGQTTETDTAQAGSASQGQIITGGTAVETGTAEAGTALAGALVAGGQVAETDTALAGAAAYTILGGQASETDTVQSGLVLYTVLGGQAGETDTAQAGSTVAPTFVAGGQVTETDTVRAGVVDDGYVDTDTANNVYALMFTGDSDVVWEPAVTPRPALLANGEAQITALKIDSVTLVADGMATPNQTAVSITRHRDRILIGGVDWTFKDDVKLEVPDYELLQPFMYGDGGTLVLPQVNARYEKLGAGLAGRLKRVKLGAKVVYQRVDEETNTVVATDYKGFILREGRAGDALALAIGGELLGRAATKWHPVPIFRKIRDAGVQLYNSVVGLGLRYTPRLQTIGINLASRGGMWEDQYLLDTVAQLTTGDGDQWTVMPDASGRYTATLKDRTTINATVYLDNALATADLGNDLVEKHNRVWINAVTPDGQRIMHASAPNLTATEVPPLPLVAGLPMTVGDVDADTSTGDGVTVLVWRLTFAGLLDREDLPGGFDEDVRTAVVDFQISAGCTNIAGSVDSETWDKLWDNFVTGYSIQFAAQRPAVEDDAVQKFDRSGNGSIIGRHDGYDETAIIVDLPLDMGPVGSRRQAYRMARHKLQSVDGVDWVGTITLTSGLIAGLHNPGMPLTDNLVIPNRAVRPGWNIWVPYFGTGTTGGGTLFHVVACQVRDKGQVVELVVDTRARDAMEAWAVKQRNRENRYQPSRYLGGPRRRSTAVQDTVTPWDKIVGQTDRDWPLAAGEWTMIPVPSGQAGTVQQTHIKLDRAVEFAALVSTREIPLGRLNRKIEPLLEPPTDPQRHHIDIAGSPTGGTFTLSGNSNTTAAIALGAPAGNVQAAIRTLGGAFATSTVSADSGDYTVTMPSSLDLDVGTNSLTGGSPTISVTTTGPGTGPGTPWWGQKPITNWLDRYGVLISWGTFENPCGYDDFMKTLPDGTATAAPLTGKHRDFQSFGYDCGLDGTVLYLYVWVGSANVLPKQRIFRQQLDGSGV